LLGITDTDTEWLRPSKREGRGERAMGGESQNRRP
jgi:hypothetical protein